MKMIPACLMGLGGLLVATTCQAADLTADEIRSELIDHSILWYENGGWHAGSLLLGHDGSAIVTVDLPKSAKDIGKWTIEDAKICTTWEQLRGSAPKCYSIRKDGDGRYITSGGNVFEIREFGV